MAGMNTPALRALLESTAAATPDEFPEKVLAALHRLIPCSHLGYNEVDVRHRRAVVVTCPSSAIPAPLLAQFASLAHQHPVIQHFLATGDPRTHGISDFLDKRTFHRLDLYGDFFRPLGVEHQLAVNLQVGADTVIGIALNRGASGFSDHDRVLLDVVRPHLAWAHAQGRGRRLGEALLGGEATAPGAGGRAASALALDGARRVRRATSGARRCVEACLGMPVLDGQHLPEPLDAWVRASLAAYPKAPPDGACALPLPDGVLRVFCAVEDAGPQAGCILILFEQRRTAPDPGARLTARERDVLAVLAEGMSTREAADRLGIARGTLYKHLENAYAKLGVHSRTAALRAVPPYAASPER